MAAAPAYTSIEQASLLSFRLQEVGPATGAVVTHLSMRTATGLSNNAPPGCRRWLKQPTLL